MCSQRQCTESKPYGIESGLILVVYFISIFSVKRDDDCIWKPIFVVNSPETGGFMHFKTYNIENG